MNTPTLSKRFLITAAVVMVVLVTAALLVPWKLVLTVGFNLFKWSLFKFEQTYRFKIAHVCAVILLAGTAALLIRTALRRRAQRTPNTTPPQNTPPNKHYKKALALALLLVLLYWSPYFFMGQETHVKIFDNLDCHIPQTKVLAESGKAFSLDPDTRLDNFIGGLALSGVDSGYNIMTWLFILFPPFTAYILNDLLVRLIALLGMALLLKHHIIKPQVNEHVSEPETWASVLPIVGPALCFSLLPFYPAGGISIAGLPLVLYAFLNILGHQWKTRDFIVLLIFPFYSKLALSGVFVCFSLGLLYLYRAVRQKRLHLPALGGLALLGGGYLLTHFHLIYSAISPDFTSFREEIRTVVWGTAESLKRSVKNFLFDRVNVVSAHHIFVLAAAATATIAALWKPRPTPGDHHPAHPDHSHHARNLSLLVTATLLTSLLWGFKYWSGMVALRERFQLLNAFDFSRFYWFNPFFWYLVFALALLILIRRFKYGKILALLFIFGQVAFTFIGYNWGYRSFLGITNSLAGSALTHSLSYREFYSEDLFEQIHHHINRPKSDYRVASLGIHPGISQYNGFHTLDIYTDIYPLEYKHQFRQIIRKEIEKNDALKMVFDENAKRCFLLSAELHGNQKLRGMIFSRGITRHESPNLKIKNLELDTLAMKKMGGEYIFSAVQILNHTDIGLTFEKIFRDSISPWQIYLYRIK